MISLDEYKQLLKTKERLTRLKDQAQGAYDQYLSRMKEETNCETKEELEKLIKKLKKKRDLKLPEYQKLEEEFWNKWKEKLEEVQ